MKINLKRKNLSGMTLVEVIVALVIFTMMMLIFATIFSYAARMNRQNYNLNERFDYQINIAKTERANIDTTNEGTKTSGMFKIKYGTSGKEVELPTDIFVIDVDEHGITHDAADYSTSYNDFNFKYFLTKFQPWGTTADADKVYQ